MSKCNAKTCVFVGGNVLMSCGNRSYVPMSGAEIVCENCSVHRWFRSCVSCDRGDRAEPKGPPAVLVEHEQAGRGRESVE